MLGSSSIAGGPPGTAAIAAGSVATANAGAAVLRSGGNAVDGVLAAAFAAAVSEPGLSSLGGGGFCLLRLPSGQVRIWDFFVNAPGIGLAGGASVVMESVTIHFAQTTQVFHAGWGSVAVPGSFAGYLALHEAHGRLPLVDIVRPAIHLADRGTPVEPVTALDFALVGAALGLTQQGRDLIFNGDRPKTTGEILTNPDYAHLLRALVDGEVSGPNDPQFIAPLEAAMAERGGALTVEDSMRYSVEQRAPLHVQRGGHQIFTNPPPSYGGAIVLRALTHSAVGAPWTDLVRAIVEATDDQRRSDLADPSASHVPTGTTHVSVIDADGMVAALTMSIGTGSGIVVPGWGVQLNNMAGEEDLNPAGLHTLAPGTRMGSMMAPTLIESPDGTLTVLGTGGSERIRSTTTCLVRRLVDDGWPLDEAVDAPRVHPAPDGLLHLEPGHEEVNGLTAQADVQIWDEPDFYFGGVHAVRRFPDGALQAVGDGRRGGHAVVVDVSGETA
jgi:gamma-glutamyltranspeptidase/glutathione hydrolase